MWDRTPAWLRHVGWNQHLDVVHGLLRAYLVACSAVAVLGLRGLEDVELKQPLQSSPCCSAEVRNPKPLVTLVEVESSWQVRGSASVSRAARPAEGSAMASAAQNEVAARSPAKLSLPSSGQKDPMISMYSE